MFSLKYSYLSKVRAVLQESQRFIYTRIFKMDIHDTVKFSLSVKFDKTNPKGVHVAENTYIAFDVAILTHDFTRGVRRHTKIGRNCFIGARSIILPGIEIGDGSIVAAGAVVVKNVPANSIVAGNPAKVIRENISVGPYGRFLDADKIQQQESLANGFD
jgi:acetyltransferase-like isoleucine patch superfamily enzyme